MLRFNLQKTAVVLLVVASLVASLQYLHSTIDLDRGAEALDAWEARLEPVKEVLPIKRGVIGYVADWDVPGVEYGLWDQEGEFMLAQYALAPLILVKGPQAEWNVAVLSVKAMEVWQKAHPGEFEVIHIKHNVYVLHRLDNQ